MAKAKNLVIVESPAKARTISKFLGSNFVVLASYGHVRDLPKSDIGVDIENNFTPKYITSKDKNHGKAVKAIKDAFDKETTEIYIATDEDREGEAIGWHLLEILKPPKKEEIKRIVFHEITKSAILKALENPRTIDINLVNAQQARRVLDRLVGYELSPLLWKKIRYGLSAGRVQSAAVRLVVEREEEIKAFDIQEYWSIEAECNSSQKALFSAKLAKYQGKNIAIPDEKNAQEHLKRIQGKDGVISDMQTKSAKRRPTPPFTTSTLQQEASRKLGFSVSRTMQVAQSLYEGVDLGRGRQGLITYMRTDSVSLAGEALHSIQKYITKEYGAKSALDKPRFYANKKNAQEAHEAIRPVQVEFTPDEVSSSLTPEQLKLYSLIWKRTVACQMAEAQVENTSVDISIDDYTFRATGLKIVFPGFMQVYREDFDEAQENDDEKILPALSKNEIIHFKSIKPLQHFTKPPARYTEASLVKKMEELGIGRPSTYAPTITTIQTRGYVTVEKKQLAPTDTATVVTRLLTTHFPNIVDYPFTAGMEEKLDQIAEGEIDWVKMLHDFYHPFHNEIESKEKEISKTDITSESIDEMCPDCGKTLVKKLSRFGSFISCSGYPECKYSRPIDESNAPREIGIEPVSGKKIFAQTGRYGPYVRIEEPEGAVEETVTAKGKKTVKKKKEKMASIIAPYKLETLTLSEALLLLSLPRNLGKDAEENDILANNGRFGPYVQKGSEFRSIPKAISVFEITLEEALHLLAQPKKASTRGAAQSIKVLGEDKKSGTIEIKSGRFGPYITNGKVNVKIPKGDTIETVTFETALGLIQKKK